MAAGGQGQHLPFVPPVAGKQPSELFARVTGKPAMELIH
jgi:hypothetical protein